MNQRIVRTGLTTISFAVTATLLYLAYFGERTAITAMRDLPVGRETGPLGDLYPAWSIWHFASAAIFIILALFQLLPDIRIRFPLGHRIIGRAAIAAAVVAATSALAIATVGLDRPIFLRSWVSLQFALLIVMLFLGLLAARSRRYSHHQQWMLRSIAVALAVLTQRLVFPIFPALLGVHSDEQFWKEFTYAAILATAINLVLAETWIRVGKLLGRTHAVQTARNRSSLV